MGSINQWRGKKLEPEKLVEAVLRQPGIDMYDLRKALDAGVGEVYKTLEKKTSP